MKRNQQIVVRPDHPYHPSRIGYFFGLGGPNQNVVVLSTRPVNKKQGGTLFCVNLKDINEQV